MQKPQERGTHCVGRAGEIKSPGHPPANCGSVWSQTFSLDPFGNLSKSGSAQFLPTYTGASGTNTSPTNQYYQISGGGSGTSNYYDTNGNLTNDVTNTYTWDAEGNMVGAGGSTTVSMIYDALDRMVEQTRSSGHTEIVYGPYGMKLALMNGQTLVNAFVKIPGGARAVYGSSGLAYFRHADHLGSSRLATTTSRTKYYDVAYAPYGEDYNGSGSKADLAFTDQNQDTVAGGWSTNLYDFMLREYRTAHGRWTSPDPGGLGVVDPTNPQTWNRYAYVQNNPLAMVDLLGDDGCYFGGSDAVGFDNVDPGICGDMGGTSVPDAITITTPSGNQVTFTPAIGAGGGWAWFGPAGQQLSNQDALVEFGLPPLPGSGGCMYVLQNPCGIGGTVNLPTGPGGGNGGSAANNGPQQPQNPQQPKTPQPNPPPQDPNRFFSEKTCFYLDWATAYAGVVALPNAENPVGWALGIGTVAAWGVGKVGGC
ncbi:MAG TPA: RHS repeat-associated core domain-containing protein [Verrucomicrobiae bacterium]|nr:RHS repeat-associated core domain-containing protein [Verrucomicrobiae bacterium]